MKSYKSALFAALTLILILGISSCNKSEGPTQSGNDMYESQEFMLAELDNSPAEIIGGDLDKPFDLIGTNDDFRFCDNQQMMMRKDFQAKRKFMSLHRIFRDLRLDEDQRESLKDFMFDYRLCIREAIMKLRETERELLAPFNEKRREIQLAYKNGEITREEAAIQLRALAAELREFMHDNPARKIACEEMKACRDLLFENISSILTEEQLEKWERWLSHMPERDCSRDK